MSIAYCRATGAKKRITMPLLLYLFKMSVSLGLLYVFYQAFLRPLTLYRWNRFCLLVYSLLSFFVPFVNITPWVAGQKSDTLFRLIPALDQTAVVATATPGFFAGYGIVPAWLILLFTAGAGVALARVLLQYVSLLRIRRHASLAHRYDQIDLFETTAPVSPFSFGQAVFFNRSLHTAAELEQILVHEMVHVKEQHSWDLLLAELICIVNWFNPFAWLIRSSIRQNLEFIADSRAIASGLDKKDYQYLLLRVVGLPQYRIAGNFNFTNLKKRIIMMNKNESHRISAARVVFSLPLLFLLLCAFRNNTTTAIMLHGDRNYLQHDTVPVPPPPPPATLAPPPPPIAAVLPAPKNKISDRNARHGSMKPLPPPPPPAKPGTPPPPRPVDPAKALYVLNGAVQPKTFSAGSLDPQNIKSVNVVTGTAATDKYGPTAASGAVEITLKTVSASPVVPVVPVEGGSTTPATPVVRYIPPHVLIVVDGKDMPAGYDPDAMLKPSAIEVVHVWKGRDALIKFGDKGKNGVVEITTRGAGR